MKLSALFTVLLAIAISAPSAHAASNISAVVNKINSGGGARANLGGGTGDPINPYCTNSPENATLLLAILCAGGLFMGRKLSQARLQQKSAVPATL